MSSTRCRVSFDPVWMSCDWSKAGREPDLDVAMGLHDRYWFDLSMERDGGVPWIRLACSPGFTPDRRRWGIGYRNVNGGV